MAKSKKVLDEYTDFVQNEDIENQIIRDFHESEEVSELRNCSFFPQYFGLENPPQDTTYNLDF